MTMSDRPDQFGRSDAVLELEIDARIGSLSAEDRAIVDNAMAGMTPLERFHLVESFFVED